MAASTTVGRFFSFLMGPNLLAIIFGTILALALPILVHYFLYRPRTEPGLPTFLLVGPSGSGKTTLLTYVSIMQAAVISSAIVGLTGATA